ncbi:MAG: 30S ribosomal protein S16 [Candidatus Peregrinibacteria bacterium]|nr:30S ribosomal protein S16 [Candidatus Peregrinibacteria bacterium]
MLMIRLQRTGRENMPTYRIVVAEKRDPVKGKFQEIVGHYLPAQNPPVFKHDDERITFWMGRGAIPSNTVARLLMKTGMKNLERYTDSYTKKRPKNEQPAPPPQAAAAPAPAPAPAAPAAEAPAKEEGDTEKKEG